MKQTSNWRPSTTVQTLKKRAYILRRLRDFFYVRDVLEVETPALSQSSVTDVHLTAFKTAFTSNGKEQCLYLQTSPEFAMKRLLAAGSGSIYQIGKAFRHEESGRFHNPEFTMLEWYRVDFTMMQLIDEVDELLSHIMGCKPCNRISYQQAFISFVGIDPLNLSVNELIAKTKEFGCYSEWLDHESSDTLLQYIFSMVIEPKIGIDAPTAVYHFPAEQASLAKIDSADPRVANRFEFYYKGVELANGFEELTDAAEQSLRFEQDNIKRKSSGLQIVEKDSLFIDALASGLPPCSGVALGVDRLIMLAEKLAHIDQVIAFPVDRS